MYETVSIVSANMAAVNQQSTAVIILEYLSSSSSEDEDFLTKHDVPKIENFPEVIYHFEDKTFKENFRLNRGTAYGLIEKYKSSRFYPSDRRHGGSPPISAELDMLTFLWFAGNKVCLRDVAQRFRVCPATCLRQNDRVMNFLLDIAPDIIKFSSNKETTAREFFKIKGFPNVVGCIDGTSIKIRTPAYKIKSTYTNRHDIPALTLQGICDWQKRFVDVFTGTSAKIHDARVFKLSDIYHQLPEICENKYHLLGDSAYSIREWLMVPFRDYGNLNELQRNYNKKFCATRVLIENTFGLLEARFRQLSEIDMITVDKISKFIVSCCVLHNLCIDNGDDEFTFKVDESEHNTDVPLPETEREDLLRRLGEIKRNLILEEIK